MAQFSLRMPDDLRDRIDAAASRNDTTRTMWLCVAAEQRLAGSLRLADAKRIDALERALKRITQRLEALETAASPG